MMKRSEFENISSVEELRRARRALMKRRARVDERVVVDWAGLVQTLSPVRLWGRAVKGAVEFASEAVALRGALRVLEELGVALLGDEKEHEE